MSRCKRVWEMTLLGLVETAKVFFALQHTYWLNYQENHLFQKNRCVLIKITEDSSNE